jgi:hypothetical protein
MSSSEAPFAEITRPLRRWSRRVVRRERRRRWLWSVAARLALADGDLLWAAALPWWMWTDARMLRQLNGPPPPPSDRTDADGTA